VSDLVRAIGGRVRSRLRGKRVAGLVVLAGLVVGALLNAGSVERYVYGRVLEEEYRRTEEAVLHWGSPGARLKVQAYLPFDCLCQGERMRVLSEAARRYGNRIYIEMVNMDSGLGARQFARSGLQCSGVFFNGRQKLRLVLDGKPTEVYFSGSPPEEDPSRSHYTAEHLVAALDQEMARLYGDSLRDAGEEAGGDKGLLLPLGKPEAGTEAGGGRQPDLDAEAFDELARALFAPVYPLLARQIVEDYGITTGQCLDVGCGPAFLSIELAKLTHLTIDALDIDEQALKLARQNTATAGLQGRVMPVQGDVQALKYPAGHFDLVVSRCSLPCWPDKVKAFREIHRVLKPKGVALVGVGSGRLLSQQERQRIVRALERLRRQQGEKAPWLQSLPSTRFLQYVTWKAGIGDPRITRTDDGVWVEFRK